MSAVNGAKRIIKRQVVLGKICNNRFPYTKYSKLYLTTNENIGAYLKILDYKHTKKALTVLSSGDHAFNLITNGVKQIDTFDTNLLTEYFVFGLKRAMIQKFEYEEFLDISAKFYDSSISLIEMSDILTSLLPYMEEPHRSFWSKIIAYNYKMQKNSENPLNLMLMLSMDSTPLNKARIIKGNEYLMDATQYTILRKNICQANITFTRADAIKLPQIFNNQYDVILLSNILDYFINKWGEYFGYSNLEHYLAALKTMVTDEGTIFINYVYRGNTKPVIRGSYIYQDHLTSEELLAVPSVMYSGNDAVLLVRKKDDE